MKNNAPGNNEQTGYISQRKQLSFYEENYILEPEDMDESMKEDDGCMFSLGFLNFKLEGFAS